MPNAIDRVNFVSNERLDKQDADRLQALVDDAVQRQLGALVGHGSGTVAPFIHTYNAGAATLSFGRFQYYLGDGSEPMKDPTTGNYKGWRGGFYEHNPTAAGQSQVFSIAAAKDAAKTANPPPASALPYIYVQPTTVNTSTEARRQWVAGADTPVSLTTVTKVVHTFNFSTAAPENMPGWARIGRIVSWSNPGNVDPGIPSIEHYSYFDNGKKDLVNGLPAAGDGTSLAGMYPWMDGLNGDAVPALSPVAGATDTHKDLSLLQMLTAVRGQLARVLDSTGGVPWWTNPNNSTSTSRGGIKQLWSYIQTLYFQFHETMPIPWAIGKFYWDGVVYLPDLAYPSRNLGVATREGGAVGVIQVDLPVGPPAGYSISGAVATAGPDALGDFNRGCLVHSVLMGKVRLRRFVCNTGDKIDGSFWLVVYIVKN